VGCSSLSPIPPRELLTAAFPSPHHNTSHTASTPALQLKQLLWMSPATLFYRDPTARSHHAPEGWEQRGLVYPHPAIFPRNLIRAFSAVSFSFSSYHLPHTKHLFCKSSPQVVPLTDLVSSCSK